MSLGWFIAIVLLVAIVAMLIAGFWPADRPYRTPKVNDRPRVEPRGFYDQECEG